MTTSHTRQARRLEEWLSTHVFNGARVAIADLRSPGVGASSEVYFADATVEGKREPLVLRMQKLSMPYYPDTNMGREYQVLRAVKQNGAVPVPEALGAEVSADVMGAPFFVMRQVMGRVPEHSPAVTAGGSVGTKVPSYNASGWLKDASPRERAQVWSSGVEAMCRVGDVAIADVAFLDAPARGAPGLAQEIRHWMDYCDWVSRTPPAIIQKARDWIASHIPPSSPPELSWGDARMGNMIFDGWRCAAIIDWESASLGGREMDLGWWLIMDQWHGRAMGLERLEGLGTRDDTLRLWEKHVGRPPQAVVFHEIFAGFRLACIVERGHDLHSRPGVERPRNNPVLGILERLMATL